METTTNVTPPRKSSKKALLIAGAVGVAILGGLGTAYAKLDLFKSAKTIYLEAEANNVKQLADDASQSFGEYEKYMKPYLEKPVHSTMELSQFNIDADIPDPQAQKVLDLLKSAKLVVEANADEQKRQQSGNFEIHLKDNKLINMEYFVDDTKMGFRFPDFYPKYGYVDLKDRDVIKEKLGEELPKRLVTNKDMYEAIKFSREEVSSIFAPYALMYAESLKDSQIAMNKNASFSEEGYKTDAREITVTFNAEEAKALFTKMAEKAKADEKLFDLIYNRYHNVSALLIDSGYPDVQELSKDEFKKEYEKAFDDALKDLKDTKNSKEQLKMIVLVDGDHQILSRKLVFVEENQKEQNIWSSVGFKNGADTYQRYSLFVEDGGEKGEMTLSYKANKQGDKTTGTVAFLFDAQPDVLLDLTTKFETTKQADKENGTYDFTLKAKSDSDPETISLTGQVTSAVTKTENGRDTDGTFKVNFEQSTPDMPKSLSMNLKFKEEFGKAITMPSLSADNAVNVATVTEEEMMQIQQEVGTAAQQFMMKNMELFQEFMPPMQ
ncbi:DUF6583 family protein [Brevibacillus borstelensis]|uniref:DUF6583 family protein n=1 Tax=Brevibacillus borstelensis TaxID=45462 RepID=UPI00148FAD3F|nr:DUF6583 family protein [Brevibacillus borstelensis]MCM3593917.1 hypothetical protein [Brevibacillus borstelensis]NOU53945.1 hypothetical protein [Brevibacillus borstelensis]